MSCNNEEHVEFYDKSEGYYFSLNKNTIEGIISQSKAIAFFFNTRILNLSEKTLFGN